MRHNAANRRRYHARHRKEIVEYNRQYEREHLIEKRAHLKLCYALRVGKVTRSAYCALCLAAPARIEGHHPDYSHPLDVVWLCPTCHRGIHLGRRRDAGLSAVPVLRAV